MTARGVTWLGLLVDGLLSLVKILVGVSSGVQTILADGLHSASDLVTDAAVLGGLRVSEKPADIDHHYGHLRVRTLVTMFVGAALLGAAAWIAYRAISTYREPDSVLHAAAPFWIVLASIVVKELLYQLTRRVGVRVSDTSLLANAWHHRTDAFTSIAAAAGLAGVAFGGPRWAFLDHLTAVVLSAFLVVVAVRIIHQSASELVDQAPSQKILAGIGEVIAETEGVRSFHALRARRLGGKVALDVRVQVDPQLTVHEGHDIANAVQARVLECGCDVLEVVVHVEPAGDKAEGRGG